MATSGLASCSNQADDNTDGLSVNSHETITLRFSHFWPASLTINTEIFESWAKEIKAESDSRLKIEAYLSAGLSKPGVTYDSIAKVIIDMGSQNHGFTSGRSPLSEILELLGLSSSATQMSCIVQTLYDNGTLAGEYKDSHFIFAYGAGLGALYMINKAVKKREDMKGLRMRHPSVVVADIMENMGASLVGMPSTDTRCH